MRSKDTVRKVSELRENPDNPRRITDSDYKRLLKSLEEFPEMLTARPLVITSEGLVIGGNMRLKALKELGIEEVPVYIREWSDDRDEEFIIKDNIQAGFWDWSVLYEDFDISLLGDWGITVPDINDGIIDTVNKGDENDIWAQVGDEIFIPKENEYKLMMHFDDEDSMTRYCEKNNIEVNRKLKNTWIVRIE